MAIRVEIFKVQNSNLKLKSVFLDMENTVPELTQRRYEMRVARDFDQEAYVKALTQRDLKGLWELGKPIEREDFQRSQEQSKNPIFEQILFKGVAELQSADVLVVYEHLQTALSKNPALLAELQSFNSHLRLAAINEKEPQADRVREHILWLIIQSMIRWIGSQS